MKHTNFDDIKSEINRQAKEKLIHALKSYSGTYEWNDDQEEDCPIIAVNSMDYGLTDVEITKVSLEDGELKIEGTIKNTYDKIEVEIEDICDDHLSYIINYLPDRNFGDDDTELNTHQTSSNKKIKIRPIEDSVVQLYDNKDNYIGEINDQSSFYDVRLQIKEQQLEGYYIVFNGEKLPIDKDGGLDNYPRDLFSISTNLLNKLLGI